MDEFESKKKSAESENKKMFRSRFDIFVLNALNDKDGGSYGYDVINYIQEKTKGHYKIKTFSTIYNTLKRLEEQNYVVSGAGDGETNGAARVYYSLTPKGKQYLDDNKQEYKYLRTLLDNLLTDEDFDLENETVPYRASELKPLTKRTRADTVTDNNDMEINDSDEAVGYVSDVSEDVKFNVMSEAAAAITEATSDVVVPQPIKVATLAQQQKDINSTNTQIVSANPETAKNEQIPTKQTKNDNEYRAIFAKITAPVINNETTKRVKSSKPKKATSCATSQHKSNDIQQKEKENLRQDHTTTIPSAVSDSNIVPSSVKTKIVNDVEHTNIEEFRKTLRNEGFALSSFNPKKTENVKYLYINRLMRDSIVLSSLYMLITLLLLYLFKGTFGFSLTAFLVCGGIALSVALVSALIWFRNPDKRRRDRINLKAINAITIGFFTAFFMIDLIVALLIPGGKGLNSPTIYSPVIIASTSMFFGIMVTVLYKTDNYFQRKV